MTGAMGTHQLGVVGSGSKSNIRAWENEHWPPRSQSNSEGQRSPRGPETGIRELVIPREPADSTRAASQQVATPQAQGPSLKETGVL